MSRLGNKNNIMGELDSADLYSRGLSSPVTSDGTFSLHRRLLNHFSDEENKDIPLDVPLTSPEAQRAFVAVPAEIISKATLLYLGFDDATATLFWSKWTNWEHDGDVYREVDPIGDRGEEMTFFDFLSGNIGEIGDAWGPDSQEWIDCTKAYGMDREFQQAILDPVFSDIRHQGTCVDWIKDTIQIRYDALFEIRKASLSREAALEETKATSSGNARSSSRGGASSSGRRAAASQ